MQLLKTFVGTGTNHVLSHPEHKQTGSSALPTASPCIILLTCTDQHDNSMMGEVCTNFDPLLEYIIQESLLCTFLYVQIYKNICLNKHD